MIERYKSATKKNWPTTKAALFADIRTTLGKESTDAKVAGIVKELSDSKVLSIDANGKVSYASKK